MVHTSFIAAAIKNTEEKARIQNLLKNPFPYKIGQSVISAADADALFQNASSEEQPPSFLDIDGYEQDTPVPIAYFVYGEYRYSGKRNTGNDPSYGLYEQNWQVALNSLKILKKLGCIAKSFEHFACTEDGEKVHQYYIYVPTLRTTTFQAAKNTPVITQLKANTDQLARFVAYLLNEGLVDVHEDHDQIIEAVGAHGNCIWNM